MISRWLKKPLLVSAFAALAAVNAPSFAEESTIPLVEQLQTLAEQETFRLRIVGQIKGEGGNVPENADAETAIKRLIPKAYSFVLGFGPDDSVTSLTVYGTDPSEFSPDKGPDHSLDSSPISELTKSVERQAGLTGDEVARDLANTLSDRSAAEIQAKLAAIELLVDMPLEGAWQALEKGLGARQAKVRLAALKAIERTGGDDAVFLMAQAFHVEADPDVLRYLSERFETMDHPLAIALVQAKKP